MVIVTATSEEAAQQVIDRFWETIPPLWGQIRANVRDIASATFDINVQQFHLLRQIRRGIRSVSELASANQISRPAISQAVDALVEKGLIMRHTSAEDRRFVVLELTPRGTDMLEAIFRENHRWMAQKLAPLNGEELDQIRIGLDALRKTFVP